MATKRDLGSLTESDRDSSSPRPSTKRARNANGHGQKKQPEPATDITYGQRCCFPGLHETATYSDDDIDLEDETDALAYLKSVRQEASGIPHLLVAPKSGPQLPPRRGDDALDYDEEPVDRTIYEDGQGDTRGYYQDGAYTAAPDTTPDDAQYGPHQARPDDEDERTRIEAAYFASLSAHFLALRARLRQPPPPRLLAALPAGRHSPHVGRLGPASRTFGVWSARLRRADPHPVQVAAMSKDGVLRVLRVLLGGRLLRRGVGLAERTSRWLWALLARLPDGGELDHTEVGHVRELGKRAALLMWSLREMAMLREEVEGGEAEDGDGDGDELGSHADGLGQEAWAGDEEEGEHEEGAEQRDEVAGGDDHEEPSAPPTSDHDPDHARSSSTAPTSVPEAHGSGKTQDADDADDMEDGEIADDSVPMDLEEDIESAKARLLANLEEIGSSAESGSKDAGRAEETTPFDPARARMNMRATLNMILTVAGEFYGQRDLLEFRDPFHGV